MRQCLLLRMRIALFSLYILLTAACNQATPDHIRPAVNIAGPAIPLHTNADSIRLIHVFVALCDNKYQGIVPVPAGIGNGQQPRTNLYWGAGYGVHTFFSRSQEWQVVDRKLYTVQNRTDSVVLDRILLRHHKKAVYLLAEAFDGRYMKQTITEFLQAASGGLSRTVQLRDSHNLYFGGAAQLQAFVGHDGLMDFSLDQQFSGDTLTKRETIILACYSKHFFSPHLRRTGAQPLLWTNGLMAPEAYTLHDAVNVWVNKGSAKEVQQAAARAYATYQKCSMRAAGNLLPTGW